MATKQSESSNKWKCARQWCNPSRIASYNWTVPRKKSGPNRFPSWYINLKLTHVLRIPISSDPVVYRSLAAVQALLSERYLGTPTPPIIRQPYSNLLQAQLSVPMSDAVGNSKRVRINQFTFNHRGKPPGINVFRAAQYDPNLLNNIENPYSPVVNTISRELPGYLTSDDILEITLSWRVSWSNELSRYPADNLYQAAMQVPFYFTIQTNKLYMRRLMRMQLARLICQGLLQFLKSHGVRNQSQFVLLHFNLFHVAWGSCREKHAPLEDPQTSAYGRGGGGEWPWSLGNWSHNGRWTSLWKPPSSIPQSFTYTS